MKERNLNLSNFEEMRPSVIANALRNIPKIQKDSDDLKQMRL